MRLSETLDVIRSRMRAQVSPEILALLDRSVQELADAQIAERTLTVGDRAPQFTLPGLHNDRVSLDALLAQGAVIVSFFQGVWCPFCNLELMAWQSVLPTLQNMGVAIVAISPQMLNYSRSTIEQWDLTYPVLSDLGNQVARQFKLVYRLPNYLIPVFEVLEHPLPRFNGDDSYELPITGTFVIGQNGSIIYAFTESDFTKRAEPTEIIQVLRDLKELQVSS